MEQQTTGEELVLTAEQAITKKRSKPELVKLDNGRYISKDGRCHPDLMVAHMLSQPRGKWTKVGTLAQVFTGANTLEGKKRVRRHLSTVFRRLLSFSEFLLYEIDPQKRQIQAVKLLDVKSEMERQSAIPQLERMRKCHQVTQDKYLLAQKVITLQETLRAEAS